MAAKKKKEPLPYRKYKNQKKGSGEGKMVVGPDIIPKDAIEVALEHSEVYVASSPFHETMFEEIQRDTAKFMEDPAGYVIDRTSKDCRAFLENMNKDSDKTDFLDRVRTFLAQPPFRRTRTDLFLVVDELFTNFTKTGVEGSSFDFFLEVDKETIVVGCRDDLGRLDPKIMLANIQRCYDVGVRQAINQEDGGGAGIGSFLMYSVSDGMVLMTEDGQRSLVMFWMRRTTLHDDRIDSRKNVIVMKKGDE